MENIMLDSTKQFIKIVGEYSRLLPFPVSGPKVDFNRVHLFCRRFRPVERVERERSSTDAVRLVGVRRTRTFRRRSTVRARSRPLEHVSHSRAETTYLLKKPRIVLFVNNMRAIVCGDGTLLQRRDRVRHGDRRAAVHGRRRSVRWRRRGPVAAAPARRHLARLHAQAARRPHVCH